MNRGRRLLATSLRPADHDQAVRMRTGKVKTTSPFVVTVGGTDITPQRLASYSPAVNDIVQLLVQSGDYIVQGKVVG